MKNRSLPNNQTAAGLADLTIRPVVVADRTAIEAIAAQVWDGHDYLPHVFDDWLQETQGLFCAALLGDQLVGVSKLTAFGDGQWWMEGLRVDPAYRAQGIGRILHHYVVNHARQFAPGELRFSTASENASVIKFARDTGFQQRAEFVAYGASAVPLATDGLVGLHEEDSARVWAFLEASAYFPRTQRTLEAHWRFYPVTPALVEARLAAGLLYGWQPDGGPDLRGLVIVNANDPKEDEGDDPALRLYLGYLDAVPGELCGLAQAVRGLAHRQGLARVSIKVLNDRAVIQALVAAGYELRWDLSVLLFARALSLTAEAELTDDSPND